MNHIKRLNPQNVIFLNCDIQTKFVPLLYGSSSVVTVATMLSKVAGVFQIPILVTEQNVRAFGPTVEEITQELPKENVLTVEQFTFSMINEDTLKFIRADPARNNFVIYGCESHVCIQQTCLDILTKFQGCGVHLITDGISSQRVLDRSAAIQQMSDYGASVTTAESLIFELLGTSKHPDFKSILPILKTDRKDQLTHL